MLRNLDIDLRLLYIIDTNKAAQYPLQLYYRYSPEKLLDDLESPYASLHAAGNDARFSLQALLVLAVKDAERSQPDVADEALFRLLKGISQALRPPTRWDIVGALAPARKAAKAAAAAAKTEKQVAKKERRRLKLGRNDAKGTETDTGEGDPGGLILQTEPLGHRSQSCQSVRLCKSANYKAMPDCYSEST